MDSRFINSQTIDYLKVKQQATFQQQLDNLKERINLESRDIDQLEKNMDFDRNEAMTRISYLTGQLTATQKAFDSKLGDLTAAVLKLQFRFKQAIAVGVAVGAFLCLIKLLT